MFYRQERIGRRGVPFRIHKFRTMRHDPLHAGPQITVGADARITRLGAFLRRTKLDELPQLLDVLRGAMSLVGPRPEVPRYVALYPAELRDVVLSVRPGITDLASIEYRDEAARWPRRRPRARVRRGGDAEEACAGGAVRAHAHLGGDARLIWRTLARYGADVTPCVRSHTWRPISLDPD